MSNDQKYPQVEMIEWKYHPDYIRLDTTKNDDWYIYLFRYLKKYINKILEGWSVKDFFENIPVDKLAVYTDTVFTDVLVGDLKRSAKEPICVSDKKFEIEENDENVCFLPPSTLFEKYKAGKISKIIVCGMFHENEIMDFLLTMGFELDDVITLSTILLQD